MNPLKPTSKHSSVTITNKRNPKAILRSSTIMSGQVINDLSINPMENSSSVKKTFNRTSNIINGSHNNIH